MLQAVSKRKRLFPLHLAPIDDFFLLDDRREYPMTYASNLFFLGNFDPLAFQAALDDTLLLHPLLHARIAPAKQGKLCWISAKALLPKVDWGGLDDPVDLEQQEFINLYDETGLRVWIRQGTDSHGERRAHLVLQFHHACCDGTGAHRFMGDLLAAYGIRTAGPDQAIPVVADYDPQMLKSRRVRLQETYASASYSTTIRRALSQGASVFGPRISPLRLNGTQHSSVPSKVVALPGVVSHSFSREQHAVLRQAAKENGGTLNDLLMAHVFTALRKWNIDHGSSTRERLRIMMPSDMRQKQDYSMPAANMTSYNFITRRMQQCVDIKSLVKSLRDETAKIKHGQLGRNFIDSIMGAKVVPGLLPFLLSCGRCLSTVTVSHMGDPTRRFLATFPRRDGKLVCGDVVLDDMLGVSPLRPQTRAAVSIVTLYRKLTINVRCDPHQMNVGDAQGFLDGFVAGLTNHF